MSPADSLIADAADWYWQSGRRRTGSQTLPPAWVRKLSGLLAESREAAQPEAPVVRVYAYGEAGAAAMVARLVGGDAAGYGSQEDGALFGGSTADQCGIAVTFSPKLEPGAPARVRLLGQAALLRALAIGYALSDEGGDTVGPGLIEAAAGALGTGARAQTRQAAEAAARLATVLQQLSATGLARYHPLGGREWRDVVQPQLAALPALPEGALEALLLWDEHEGMSALHASLEALRDRLGLSESGPITASPEAAALLAAPTAELVASGRGLDRRDPQRLVELEALAKRLRVRRPDVEQQTDESAAKNARIYVADNDDSESGSAALGGVSDLVLLQAMCAELILPAAGQGLAPDGPALGHAPSGRPLPAPIEEVMDGRLLAATLLQTGKSLDLGLGTAERPVAPLVLCEAGDEIAPSAQPVLWASPNAALVIEELGAALLSKRVPAALPDALPEAVLVMAAEPADSAFSEATPAKQDAAFERLADAPSWSALARDPDAMSVLTAGLSDGDGGYAAAFRRAGAALDAEAPDRGRRIADLLRQAAPQTGWSPERRRESFASLAERLRQACAEGAVPSARRQAALELSALLREALYVAAEDLEPLPKQLGADHDRATSYVLEQLPRWAARPPIRALLQRLGVPDEDASNMTRALQDLIDPGEVGLWLIREFPDITAGREALHARTYTAALLTRRLFGQSGGQAAAALDTQSLQDQLNRWADPTAPVEQSLHYQQVIDPVARRFDELAKQGGGREQVAAPPDAALSALLERAAHV